MTSRTSSTGLSMNSATASTIGASASRIAAAWPASTRRRLRAAKTKPTASTPSSPARRTSPARVMPQNLILVRNGGIDTNVIPSGGAALCAVTRKPDSRHATAAGSGQRHLVGQAMDGRIQRTEEHQPGGRRGRAGEAAVAPGQQFADPVLAPRAGADLEQRTDDVAHHVVQEGVGLDVDRNHVAFAPDGDALQFAPRVAGLALAGAERAEIVLAQERLRGA